MGMELFRRHQKWLMAGLAAFLAVVWGAGINRGSCRRGGGNPVVARSFGRTVRWAEMRQKAVRLERALGGRPEDGAFYHALAEFLAYLHVADEMGITVSDAEVSQAIKDHARLRREQLIECVVAAHSGYSSDVKAPKAEVEKYYEEHKDEFKKDEDEEGGELEIGNGGQTEYKPLDNVRNEIERKIRDQKAGELAKADIRKVRGDVINRLGRTPRDALEDAADAVDGVKYETVSIKDDPGFIRRQAYKFGSSEDFVKSAFELRVGEISPIYQATGCTFFCRPIRRAAGYDRDGQFHSKDQGWKEGKFDDIETLTPSQLIWRALRKCSVDECRMAIADRRKMSRVSAWVASVGRLPKSVLKERYLVDSEKVNMRYLAIDIDDFADAVIDPDEEETRNFYDAHKDTIAMQEGQLGYMLPEMAKIEYVIADPDKLKTEKRFKPTAAEAKEYYEKHKDEYKKPLPDAEGQDTYKSFNAVKSQVEKKVTDYKVQHHMNKLGEVYQKIQLQARAPGGGGDPKMGHFAKMPEYNFQGGRSQFFSISELDKGGIPYQLRNEPSFLPAVFLKSRRRSDGALMLHTDESWKEEFERTEGLSPEEIAQQKARSRSRERDLLSDQLGDKIKYFFRILEWREAKTYEYDDLVELAEAGSARETIIAHIKEKKGLEEIRPENGEKLTDEQRKANEEFWKLCAATDEECKLAQRLLSRVKDDWRREQAISKTTDALNRLRRIAARKAIDDFAAANKLEVKATQPYATEDVLPDEIDKIEPLRNVLAGLEPGGLAPIVQAGDICYLAMIDRVEADKPDEEQKSIVRYVAFDANKITSKVEPTDDDLEDLFAKNRKDYEDHLPETGKATIQYVALKLDDVRKTVKITDEDIKKHFEANKDNLYKGKKIEDVKADITKTLTDEKTEEAADELMETVRKEINKLARDDDIDSVAEEHKDVALEVVKPEEFPFSKAADVPQLGKVKDFEKTLERMYKGMVSEILETEAERFIVKAMDIERKKRLEQREFDELDDEGKKAVRNDWAADLDKRNPRRKAILRFNRRLAAELEATAKNTPITASVTVRTSAGSWPSANNARPPYVWNRHKDEFEKIMAMKPGEISEPIAITKKSFSRRGSSARKSKETTDYYIVHIKNKEDKFQVKAEYVIITPRDVGEAEDKPEVLEKLVKSLADDLHKAVAGGKSFKDAIKDMTDRFREPPKQTMPSQLPPPRMPSPRTTQFLTQGDPRSRFGKEFNDAIFKLEKKGDLAPVIELQPGVMAIARLAEKETAPVAEIDFVLISSSNVRFPTAVADEQAEEHYNNNKEDYREGATVTVEYIYGNLSDYSKKMKVTDEQLKKFYEDNKEKYWRIRGAEPPKPQFRPYDDVKNSVEVKLRFYLATDELAGKLEEIRTKWAKKGKAEDYRREYGLKTGRNSSVSEESLRADRRKKLDERTFKVLGTIPKIWKKIEPVKKGELTEVVKTYNKVWLGKIIDRKDSYIPEFDEVKERVMEDAADRFAEERAPKVAAGYRETLAALIDADKTKSLKDAADETPLKVERRVVVEFESTGYFPRRQRSPWRGDYRLPRIPGIAGDLTAFVDAAVRLVPGTTSPVIREKLVPKSCYVLAWRDMLPPDKEDVKRFFDMYGFAGYGRRSRTYEDEIKARHTRAWLDALAREAWQPVTQ